MILRYRHVSRFPRVFKAMTGVDVPEFDTLVRDILPRFAAAERTRLQRPTRKPAIGAGHPFTLDARDQLLLTVVWLRQYPLHEVLAYLFAVSDSTVSRDCADGAVAGGLRTRHHAHARSRQKAPPQFGHTAGGDPRTGRRD